MDGGAGMDVGQGWKVGQGLLAGQNHHTWLTWEPQGWQGEQPAVPG